MGKPAGKAAPLKVKEADLPADVEKAVQSENAHRLIG